MKVEIGGREFVFTKKNLRMRNLFSDIVDLVQDLSLLAEEAEEESDTLSTEREGESLSPVDFLKKRKETRARFREIDRRRREIGSQMAAKRLELLRVVVEKNGYNFDKNFWEDEADIDDINEIVSSLFKEQAASKK